MFRLLAFDGDKWITRDYKTERGARKRATEFRTASVLRKDGEGWSEI